MTGSGHEWHLRRNEELSAEAIDEFGLADADLDASEGGETKGDCWLREGRVFAIDTPAGRRFPKFQFSSNGEPRAVIAEVLAAFEGRLSGRETLLWFTGSHGWLDGDRPVDCLESDPASVVEAAGRLLSAED